MAVRSRQRTYRIVYGYEVDFEGTGEILKVVSRPQDGWRNLDIDPTNGYINNKSLLPHLRPTLFNEPAITRADRNHF